MARTKFPRKSAYDLRVLRPLLRSGNHYGQEEGSCDALSSGERNGYSPNHSCLHEWGCRAAVAFSCGELPIVGITKLVGKRDPSR